MGSLGIILTVIAALAFAVGVFVNRGIKVRLHQAVSQANTFKVKGNVNAPISQSNSNTGGQSISMASPSATPSSGLSLTADILQVVSFVILMLQLFKVLPAS
jgi:hypothetical protein